MAVVGGVRQMAERLIPRRARRARGRHERNRCGPRAARRRGLSRACARGCARDGRRARNCVKFFLAVVDGVRDDMRHVLVGQGYKMASRPGARPRPGGLRAAPAGAGRPAAGSSRAARPAHERTAAGRTARHDRGRNAVPCWLTTNGTASPAWASRPRQPVHAVHRRRLVPQAGPDRHQRPRARPHPPHHPGRRNRRAGLRRRPDGLGPVLLQRRHLRRPGSWPAS